MSWMSVLCGQCAMLMLVAGSLRGNRVFWHDHLTQKQRCLLQSCAAAGLLLSLVLQLTSDAPVILSIIEWVLLAGPEIMIAALVCSVRETRSRS